MRLISIIIAVLVSVTLYFVVFERDQLSEFAGNAPDTTDVAADADTFAPPAEKTQDDIRVVKVVARHSAAQSLDSAVVLRGETEAAREVNVPAETTGQVISEPLRKGAYVEAGELLCKIDPGTRESSLAEARAGQTTAESRVIEARAGLTEAEKNLSNAEKLAGGGYASDTQVIASTAALESARAGLISAEAGVESAKAAIAMAQKEIDRLTITAPFSGLLESDAAEFGSLMQPGSTCATVVQLDPIKLVGFVPEAEVNRITVGAPAMAHLVEGTQITGRVTFLSRAADPTTRTFRVEVKVPNSGLAIRDGQTVEMVIASEGKSAHLVAQSTLTLNDEGQIGVRIVDADSIARFRPVEILRDTREGMWVAGLEDTVDLITVGQEFVTDGVKVAPTFAELNQ